METYIKLGAVVLVAFFVLVGSCSYDKRRTLEVLIEKGASPTEAKCAVYVGDFAMPECFSVGLNK